ncbi:MAG TPA: V-type ATP synthase subunit E family protein [Candidatus Bilamarchaeaceae archaeon]|nr:V-type ATP synthase subunit E family protein [Candidatus Bilamarchaeaceae archaeon]
MGVEKLSTAILEDSKKEAQKITASAQEQADQLLHEENAKFVLLRKSSEESTKELMDAHTNERLAWARLESKRINAEAKEDAISNSLESFLEELNKSKKSKKYKEFVIRSAKTAYEQFGKDAVFYICRGEKSLLPKGLNAKVVESDLSGGLIIESSDAKFRLDFSFDSLFDVQKEDLRKMVYQMLFEKKSDKK